MITACGWLPHQVGDIEWWSVVELQDYWADHPPVHELVAAYLGVKPRAKLDAADPSGIGALMSQFPHGLIPANR